MPFCPKCKYEYREGIKICPDCDVPLRTHLHENPPEYTDEPLVRVAKVYHRLEADTMKGVLESAGIPCYVYSDFSVATRAAVYSRNRGYSLIVQKLRYQDAVNTLESAVQSGRPLE